MSQLKCATNQWPPEVIPRKITYTVEVLENNISIGKWGSEAKSYRFCFLSSFFNHCTLVTWTFSLKYLHFYRHPIIGHQWEIWCVSRKFKVWFSFNICNYPAVSKEFIIPCIFFKQNIWIWFLFVPFLITEKVQLVTISPLEGQEYVELLYTYVIPAADMLTRKSQYKDAILLVWIPTVMVRISLDCLIFIIGISMPGACVTNAKKFSTKSF